VTSAVIQSDLTYFRSLVRAGWSGAVSATPVPATTFLAPATLGACIGALTAFVAEDRKAVPSVTAAALIGAAVGVSAAAASGSCNAVRLAVQRINAARDLHWLEKNPIDYG
jgi:hypothetical protein